MKKNLRKLILSPLIFCLLFCFTVSPAYASEDNMSGVENFSQILTVVGVSENKDKVYLNNDSVMYQSSFHKYSGKEFDLKYGDVIKVYSYMMLETFPSQFSWCDGAKIEYLGKAGKYFENKKKLVVTKKSDRCDIITFEDSDGTEYLWRNNLSVPRCMPNGLKRVGCKIPPEFDPDLINVGDKLLCVMSTEKFYDKNGVVSEKETVYLPVSEWIDNDVPAFEHSHPEPFSLTLTVVGVSENEDVVYLNNLCAMYQGEFHEYSGEEFDLKYGDVIKVYCCSIMEIYPSRFSWCTESKIEYLGKAADYFENKKELVVTKKSDRCDIITFEDSAGTEYLWRNSFLSLRNMTTGWAGISGFKTPTELDPDLINVGDKLLCVVSTDELYYGCGITFGKGKEGVYLPVAQVESSDNSETFSVANLVFMQKYLTRSYEDSIQKFSNYDINGDGAVNVFDVIILRRMILSNKFHIY